ncbi:uncharacterized protein LOC141595787 [Silene latifolia]|uniref:uncharacterized protein LOC141595787 n=1 Tax=Silene latifolia TaxID=37657 RepID=UPI003D783FCB
MATKRITLKKSKKSANKGDGDGEGEHEAPVAMTQSKSSTGRRKKKVVAVEDEVEEPDVATEGTDDEEVDVGKGTRKKVTFSLGSAKDKGKGKAVEEDEQEEEEEDDIETDVDEEEEEEVDTDVVNEAVKLAVNAWKSAQKKKAVGKPREVTEDCALEPKALKVIQRKREVGEGSKKRKGGEYALVLAKKKKEVDGHGSPRQLFNLIGVLTESQRKDVEDIGFGGLLELRTHAFYHQMVDWLLRKYDPSSRMFLFNRHVQFVLTRHDVYDAFMIPCTDKQIDARTDHDVARLWRDHFKLSKQDGLSCFKVPK